MVVKYETPIGLLFVSQGHHSQPQLQLNPRLRPIRALRLSELAGAAGAAAALGGLAPPAGTRPPEAAGGGDAGLRGDAPRVGSAGARRGRRGRFVGVTWAFMVEVRGKLRHTRMQNVLFVCLYFWSLNGQFSPFHSTGASARCSYTIKIWW